MCKNVTITNVNKKMMTMSLYTYISCVEVREQLRCRFRLVNFQPCQLFEM